MDDFRKTIYVFPSRSIARHSILCRRYTLRCTSAKKNQQKYPLDWKEQEKGDIIGETEFSGHWGDGQVLAAGVGQAHAGNGEGADEGVVPEGGPRVLRPFLAVPLAALGEGRRGQAPAGGGVAGWGWDVC